MISNGSLLRIDTRTGASLDGQETFDIGGDIAAGLVGVFLDEVSSSQKWTLGATISDASQVCYVASDDLCGASLTPPVEGDKLTVTLECGQPFTGKIVLAKHPSLGDLTHYVYFLKVV